MQRGITPFFYNAICCLAGLFFIATSLPIIAATAPVVPCGTASWPVLSPQQHDSLFVERVDISGNEITRRWIIMRELSFAAGSRVPRKNLDSFFELEENKLQNTNLFITQKINWYEISPDTLAINIELQERWYTFPIPLIEIADRNFNEWWSNQDRDFSRLQYGINFKRRNFRGRNETVQLIFKAGYTEMASLGYSVPFINKQKTLGMAIRAGYSRNRNTIYNTIAHRQVNVENESEFMRERFSGSFTLTHRKGFYTFHRLDARYSHSSIADTVAYLNPGYFADGATRQNFFSLGYTYIYDFRDFAAYPLKGLYFTTSLQKLGLGVFNDLNALELQVSFSKYFDLGSNFYFATNLSGLLALPEQQPYQNRNGIGYSRSIIRGYDLYVIDGNSFGLSKNTLRYKLLDTALDAGKLVPVDQFSTIPLAIYLKSYFDVGKVRNSNVPFHNRELTNETLWGGGFGVDIVTFYNAVWRFEYSFNSRGENGLFVYFSTDI